MDTFVQRFQKSNAGMGALGAVLATSLGMAILAGGSRFYIKTKSNEAAANELRGKAANIQGNAVALTDKLLRGGVISEVNGSWQVLGTPPTSTWSFQGGVITSTVKPKLFFQFCDPQKILSGAESPANCTQSVTASTSILGRQPSGKIDLSNYSLVTKASRRAEAKSKARVSGAALCKSYNGTQLVSNLFRSILGRDPLQSELQIIMPCVASGDVLAWDLESTSTGFCGGKVKGLRAYPEYDRRKESVYAVFRSNLGRMPGSADTARVNGYIARLNVPDSNFISTLMGVAVSIRTDYALGSAVYSPHMVHELYEVVYQGAYMPIDLPTNTFLLMLARGEGTLSTVVDLMRQIGGYRSDNPGINSDWARRSEGLNFIYYALTGKHLNQMRLAWGIVHNHPFDVANWYGVHAWLLDYYHSDPTQNGYQWMASMFQSGSYYDFESARVVDSGICNKPMPRPQTILFGLNYQAGGNWNAGATGASGYVDGRLCGVPPNHVYVTNAEQCPSDKPQQWVQILDAGWFWTIQVPKPDNAVASVSTQALVFGYVTSGVRGTTALTPSAPPNGFSSFYTSVQTFPNLSGGQTVRDSVLATGLGGSNTVNYAWTVPPQKRSCLVTTDTWYSWSRDLSAMNAWVPAPAVASFGSGNDASHRYILPNVGTPYAPTFPDGRRYAPAVPQTLLFGMTDGGTPETWFDQTTLRNAVVDNPLGGILGPNLMNLVRVWGNGDGGAYFRAPLRFPAIPKSFSVDGIPYQMRTDGNTFLTTQDQFRNQSAWGSQDCQYFTIAISPLVVDLYQEGVEFTKPGKGVRFDMGGGKNESHYWVGNSGRSGFLSLDRNHNGQIDSINELFGDKTIGTSGKSEANGFLALGRYDANHDRRIDAQDAIYSELTLWFDSNGNGLSEKGELKPISLTGIKEIDLEYLTVEELADRYGNTSKQRSVVEMADGSFRIVFDVYVVPNPVFE